MPKEGGRYDLAHVLALLVASEQLNMTRLNQYEFVGELALTGVGYEAFRGRSPAQWRPSKSLPAHCRLL
ncbi:magnesium chelatase domain-containing protein [Klebsiella pneumoniae]|uniref:magnesium chelatase domain-containing protein n=1 Tax=Klebsiella pneumoniae TaxID=573 RepID=UPI0038907EAA